MQTDNWQKCRPPFIPRRTIDGGWTSTSGQTWRRWRNGAWEYKQDAQTFDEWEAKQW